MNWPAVSPAITELKVRARLRLNTLKKAAAADTPGDRTLRDCLNAVAAEVGFAHWEHARRVFAGEAPLGDDMGSFWHAPACGSLLNEWHADYAKARDALQRSGTRFLLPFRRQFVVVQADFLRELKLDPADSLWDATGRDLVTAYGTQAWSELAAKRLRAPVATFEPMRVRSRTA